MEYHVSLAAKQRYDFHVNSSSYINDSAFSNSQGLSALGPHISCSSLDKMMTVAFAYGDKLLYSDGGPRDSGWCQHWSIIVQHMGQHYSLLGGSIGKKYIDLLCDELQYLSLGTYHSERLIVFLLCHATEGPSSAQRL